MTRQKQYYKNHKVERLEYQKEWRRKHKDGKNTLKKSTPTIDLPLPQVKHTEVNIEESLIRDIKEYSKLFPAHPKPSVADVLVWAELYGVYNIQDGAIWVRKLIKQALNGIKGEKRVESSFILYEERRNEISIPLLAPRLGELAIK